MEKIIIKDDLTRVLFIATEMDPEEIQTLILAYVSGVNEEKNINEHSKGRTKIN